MGIFLAHRARFLNISVVLFAFLSLLLIYSKSFWLEGGQDSWNHYLISRYTWKYPDLFLEQWGKPVFNILSSPFSQFGIHGLVLFNIICTLSAGVFNWLTAIKLNFRFPIIAFIATVFLPILFGNTISGLTEPLNAALISLMIWAFASHKFAIAAILASVMPFSRTEGFAVLLIAGAYLIVEKQYKYLWYLLAGPIIFNFVGYAITGNVFWIITDNPYVKFAQEGTLVVEKGPLFHYIYNAKFIWGRVFSWFIAAGSLIVIYLFLKVYSLKQNKSFINLRFFLILGIFAAYLVVHSILYFTGWFGSVGFIRVLAPVSPLAALLGMEMLEAVYNFLARKNYQKLFAMIFTLGIVVSGFAENDYFIGKEAGSQPVKFPRGLSNYQMAVGYIKQNNLQNRMLIHQLPWLNVIFNRDPHKNHAQNKTMYMWSYEVKNDWLPEGSIVIYDGYHCFREGNIKLEQFKDNSKYKLLQYFPAKNIPEPFIGHYDIWIFEKK